MYAIYGNIYHQYTPNVSIYTIHGSYGIVFTHQNGTTSETEVWANSCDTDEDGGGDTPRGRACLAKESRARHFVVRRSKDMASEKCRERERERCVYIYIYIYIHTVTTFKYVEGGPDREAQEVV